MPIRALEVLNICLEGIQGGQSSLASGIGSSPLFLGSSTPCKQNLETDVTYTILNLMGKPLSRLDYTPYLALKYGVCSTDHVTYQNLTVSFFLEQEAPVKLRSLGKCLF